MRGWKTMRRDLLALCIVSTFSFITSFDSAVMAKQVPQSTEQAKAEPA